MSKSKTTKEERLLLAIAKAAKNSPSSSINVKEISQTLGFSEKQALKALHLLARGNFIKKKGEWEVELSSHGHGTVELMK